MRFDIPITILKPASRNSTNGTNNVISTDYAHRRDRRESTIEVDGVTTFSIERQYLVQKDTEYIVEPKINQDAFGKDHFGATSFGGNHPSEPPVARDGSNANRGLILRDDETKETFSISGTTRLPDERIVVIHCDKDSVR